MLLRICKRCGKEFRSKPFHVKNGAGIFCSRACSHESMRNRLQVSCTTCGKELYKTPSEIERSKSKKYFCDKSCQTIWRNKVFSGEKHKSWAGGGSAYRDILRKTSLPKACGICRIADMRVLAVHHIDHNHKNNEPANLQWLCHNCHYLIHHKLERQKVAAG